MTKLPTREQLLNPILEALVELGDSGSIDEINESLSKTTKILLDNSIEYVRVSKNWSFMEVAFGILTVLAALIMLFKDVVC